MPCVIPTSLSLITAPVEEPVYRDLLIKHLRWLEHDEDDLLDGWIAAARDYFERETGRQLITATYEYWLDQFPDQRLIELPKPPLQQVLAVQYVDGDGVLQNFTQGVSPDQERYVVRAPHGAEATRGWIELLPGDVWPTTRDEAGAVRIQFVAGYGDTPEEIPPLIAQMLALLVGQFDQFRSELHQTEPGQAVQPLPLGVPALLTHYKMTALPRTVPLSWR